MFRSRGQQVCLLTPESKVSLWTQFTLEQEKIQSRLLDLDVEIVVSHAITGLEANKAHVKSDLRQRSELNFDSIIMVTSRNGDNALYRELQEFEDRFKTLRALGRLRADNPSVRRHAIMRWAKS